MCDFKISCELNRWTRKQMGITAQQVAEVLKIPVEEVESYENGQVEPGLISAAYRMSLELIQGEIAG